MLCCDSVCGVTVLLMRVRLLSQGVHTGLLPRDAYHYHFKPPRHGLRTHYNIQNLS